MAKTTVEFNEGATAELERLGTVLDAKKADVLRSALALYAFIVDELSSSKKRQLGIVENDQVKKVIVVPGLRVREQATEEPERVERQYARTS